MKSTATLQTLKLELDIVRKLSGRHGAVARLARIRKTCSDVPETLTWAKETFLDTGMIKSKI